MHGHSPPVNTCDPMPPLSLSAQSALAKVQKARERIAGEPAHKDLMSTIRKVDEAERIVFGEVLIPDVEDAQDDIIDAPTIRAAALGFMAKHRRVGVMHKFDASELVQIVESYIAPSDFSLDGYAVSKGTWLMTHRIIDDDIWQLVLNGNITGFSIGGYARRVPL